MAFKIVLMLSVVLQVMAAALALRLNFRYRVYSAWVLISAAAFVMAILRVSMLIEIWPASPSIFQNGNLWTSVISSLMVSSCLLAGLALVEPFFRELDQAHQSIQREHERLKTDLQHTEAELQLARQIQRDLLPAESPGLAGLDIAARCEPAEWTSGDFYDYVPLANGDTAIVVADACGHGLGPAILISGARASIRAVAKTVDDVGQLLTQINPAIYDHTSARFITAFAIRITQSDCRITYAGAGQPAFLLRHDGRRKTLMPQVPPLGVVAQFDLRARNIGQLEAGDVLVMVTDGILETMDDQGNLFGAEKLYATVANCRELRSRDIVEQLYDAARDFAADGPLADDNTIVVVKAIG